MLSKLNPFDLCVCVFFGVLRWHQFISLGTKLITMRGVSTKLRPIDLRTSRSPQVRPIGSEQLSLLLIAAGKEENTRLYLSSCYSPTQTPPSEKPIVQVFSPSSGEEGLNWT